MAISDGSTQRQLHPGAHHHAPPPASPTTCAHPTPQRPSCDPLTWSATSVCGSARLRPATHADAQAADHHHRAPGLPGHSILSSGPSAPQSRPGRASRCGGAALTAHSTDANSRAQWTSPLYSRGVHQDAGGDKPGASAWTRRRLQRREARARRLQERPPNNYLVIAIGTVAMIIVALALLASLINLWPSVEAAATNAPATTAAAATAATTTHTVRLFFALVTVHATCLLYTSPSPRD